MSDQFHDFVADTVRSWGLVGASVALVSRKRDVWTAGFGIREVGRAASVNADTLFQVGSVTKPFTAAALALLKQEGLVDWDDKIADILPSFALPESSIAAEVNLRDILAHRCGMSDRVYPFLTSLPGSSADKAQFRVAPSGRFRESFTYCNILYGVAGDVVSQISGCTWEKFIQDRLLEPLKMVRSTASPSFFEDLTVSFLGGAENVPPGQNYELNAAIPHTLDRDGNLVTLPWQVYPYPAAGALVSTASDLALWLEENIFRDKHSLLQSSSILELHSVQNTAPISRLPPHLDPKAHYTLGWHRGQFLGHEYLWHAGGMIGSPALIVCIPSRQLGVAVLSNGPARFGPDRALWANHAIAAGLIELALGQPFTHKDRAILLEATRSLRADEQKISERSARCSDVPQPSLPLSGYTGVFAADPGERVEAEVVIKDRELHIQFPRGGLCAPLRHLDRNVFQLWSSPLAVEAIGDPQVYFTVSESGRADSFDLFGMTYKRCEFGRMNS